MRARVRHVVLEFGASDHEEPMPKVGDGMKGVKLSISAKPTQLGDLRTVGRATAFVF